MSVYTKKSDTHEERYYHIPLDTSICRLQMATIFARKDHERGWEITGAFCHRDDTFSRKRGRTIARRRFFNDPELRIPLPAKDMTYELAHRLAKLAEGIWPA